MEAQFAFRMKAEARPVNNNNNTRDMEFTYLPTSAGTCVHVANLGVVKVKSVTSSIHKLHTSFLVLVVRLYGFIAVTIILLILISFILDRERYGSSPASPPRWTWSRASA